MSAYAFAETCVFGKQSLEPVSCDPLTPLAGQQALLGHPFFRRYGVNLPSSLTEAHSSTSGAFSLPTSVGLRYGRNAVWLAAFLGGLGASDFRLLAETRPSRHAPATGLSLGGALRSGNPACPLAGLTCLTASPLRSLASRCGAGLSNLLSIAYDYDVLGLGPD